MQFTDEEWLGFANGLRRATDAGRLKWETLDGDPTAFIAHVRGNAIYAMWSRDGDGQFPYTLEISDLGGAPLAEFTTVAYTSDVWGQPDQDASNVIDGLYRDVTRLVTGAPQRAQELLKGLADLSSPEEFKF